MEVSGDSLDAVLFELYQALLKNGARNTGTRGGTTEMLALSIRLAKPRARLSRSESRGKAFSPLGELLWYLAKSDKLDFIEPYIGEYRKDAVDGVLPGAYGPRLFAMRGEINQIDNVIKLLQKKKGSRRAVIQLFNAEDIATEHSEIPCTTTLQFHLREGFLHLSVTMRSNDAVWGLPHDVFCFTMIQEMMARVLDAELGEYYHFAGSMHIYDKYIEKAEQYVREGFQRTVEMPTMPKENPFDLVGDLLAFEGQIRNGAQVLAKDAFPDPYWADIGRLLQAFWAGGDDHRLDELKLEFNSPIYKTYLDGRRNTKSKSA